MLVRVCLGHALGTRDKEPTMAGTMKKGVVLLVVTMLCARPIGRALLKGETG